MTHQPEDERIAKAMWHNWYGSSDENKDDALWSRHRAEWLAAWKKAFCNLQIVSADTIPVPAEVWKQIIESFSETQECLQRRTQSTAYAHKLKHINRLARNEKALEAARTIEGSA